MSAPATCSAPIQQGLRKGSPCGNATHGSAYCQKHMRQHLYDKAAAEQIRYCDIPRGCYTVLESHQAKCTRCLHATRIQERQRNDKKRQDPTLCLDCGKSFTQVPQAVGKKERLLRRCIPCYEILQKTESARPKRERNYKAEAFSNKHVIWNHYVKGARRRGIDFDLTKSEFESLIIQPCFYCQSAVQGEVNGIDRMDNNIGYQSGNVVPCCEACNSAKGSQHPLEFVDKLCAIHCFTTLQQPVSSDCIERWKSTYRSVIQPSYNVYAKSARRRNLAFDLTADQFTMIVQQPCYLCGLPSSDTNHNGIDRVNNRIGYIESNCKSCCGHCNLLKKEMDLADLLSLAKMIASRSADLTGILQGHPIAPRTSKTAPRKKKESPQQGMPVAMKYKPVNEVIQPSQPISVEIQDLLEKKESEPPLIKQWKVSCIYHAISQNRENDYKTHCEVSNDLSLYPNWEMEWVAFVLSVKGHTEKEATPMIRAFVENLRRIRHNQLCASKRSGDVNQIVP